MSRYYCSNNSCLPLSESTDLILAYRRNILSCKLHTLVTKHKMFMYSLQAGILAVLYLYKSRLEGEKAKRDFLKQLTSDVSKSDEESKER